jgi:hypothetical protein
MYKNQEKKSNHKITTTTTTIKTKTHINRLLLVKKKNLIKPTIFFSKTLLIVDIL